MKGNRYWLICGGLFAVVIGAWLCQSVYVFSVKDFSTEKRLFAAYVSPGEELIDIHNHSVFGSPVYHLREIGENAEFIVKSVRSTSVVLFSQYPGYGYQTERGIELPGNSDGLIEVRIDKVIDKFILAVGDEHTDTRLIFRGQQIPLTEASESKVVEGELTRTRRFSYLFGYTLQFWNN